MANWTHPETDNNPLPRGCLGVTSHEDLRQQAKVLYPLDEVLLLGVIAGCESWVEIARYGEE